MSLRISLDAEHQQKVPVSRIISLIRSAVDIGVEINFTLRRIPGRADPVYASLVEIERALPDYYALNRSQSRWLNVIPHMPIPAGESLPCPAVDSPCIPPEKSPVKSAGKATGIQAENSSPERSKKHRKSCDMVFRDLVIGEDRLIYPCCGFFSLPLHIRQIIALGNPLNESWQKWMEWSMHHSLCCVLKEKGPYYLGIRLNIAMEKMEIMESCCLYNKCSLCLALFKEYGEIIRDRYGPVNPISPVQSVNPNLNPDPSMVF